ncbi:MAG: type I methionyl aminopeptidase [Patescibacteria group bacterium]
MICIYSSSEIKSIADSGAILAEVFEKTTKEARVGMILKDLDKLAFKLIKELGAEPAFLNYRPSGALKPYSATICASVNDVIVHGLPDNYQLKNGDVLKLDSGVKHRGFYSDAAITVGIGTILPEAGKLIKATKMALEEAIKMAKPGNFLGDIGWVIEKVAKKFGVKTIKELTGHGIGRELHEDPTIYNFGKRGKGIELKSGMVLAIEPMFAIGTEKIIQKKDESWATADGSLSAHFEHTIAITDKGPKVLTQM